MDDGSLSLGNLVADITSTASGPSSTRCSDETDEARHRCLRGSENRRCWSSCVLTFERIYRHRLRPEIREAAELMDDIWGDDAA